MFAIAEGERDGGGQQLRQERRKIAALVRRQTSGPIVAGR
jgi:hypothetical protein